VKFSAIVIAIVTLLTSITTPARIRDVYSPDSNDSGIVADHSMTSRHVTNPEPDVAEIGGDKPRQQQVGVVKVASRHKMTRCDWIET